MTDIKDRAREYIAEHSEYSEVFGGTFIAVDTFTAMVEFAEQETKELEAQIEKMKCCQNCKYFECCDSNHYYCSLYCGLECEYDKSYKNWEIKEND